MTPLQWLIAATSRLVHTSAAPEMARVSRDTLISPLMTCPATTWYVPHAFRLHLILISIDTMQTSPQQPITGITTATACEASCNANTPSTSLCRSEQDLSLMSSLCRLAVQLQHQPVLAQNGSDVARFSESGLERRRYLDGLQAPELSISS